MRAFVDYQLQGKEGNRNASPLGEGERTEVRGLTFAREPCPKAIPHPFGGRGAMLAPIAVVRNTMPRVSTQEFERLPLRVHSFLTGVPLHDVWYVDLPRWRSGVTL